MDFDFDVGVHEIHKVHYHFNQWLGVLRIAVDGELAETQYLMFARSTSRRSEFIVGSDERHNIAIEKTRKRINGGLRKQNYRIFVDGQLIAEH